jgi:hypothetical protein
MQPIDETNTGLHVERQSNFRSLRLADQVCAFLSSALTTLP